MFATAVKKLLHLFLRPVFSVFWFLLYLKLLLFWVWLWQLKEYHWGRFKAHFETQKLKKIVSAFWWLKFPKLTPKIVAILFINILLGISILFLFSYLSRAFFISHKEFYFSLFILIILAPLLFLLSFLFFQIPTQIWQKKLLEKAKKKRKKFKNLIVIGITGSYGKTSTKEFLATILSEKFKVLKTKEHINAEVGIANTILKELTPDYEVLIAEIGAYERGKIRQVCKILQPKIGILTGINEQHMSTFGSQENIIKAKYELIEGLPEDGIAIFNKNNKYCLELYKKTYSQKIRRDTFSTIVKNVLLPNIETENVKIEKEKVFFRAISETGEKSNFRISIVGAQNIENILIAAQVAKQLGMSLEEISKACEKIKPFAKTMQLKKGRGGVTIIDDTYSANPVGVIAALDYLKLYQGKKIIIMPCLIELGKASKAVHKRIGKKIGKICDLAIITTKDYLKEIKDGAIGSGMKEDNILFLENPKEIFKKLKLYLKPENIILLESRVPKELIDLLLK